MSEFLRVATLKSGLHAEAEMAEALSLRHERRLMRVRQDSEHFAGGVDTAKFRTAEKPESEQKKPTSAKHWKAYSVSEKEFKEAASAKPD